MDLKELKKELLKNPEIKREFEKYDLAYEISQMLIEARIIKGITQEKLAEMIHTKQSGIARAERGISLPSLSFLEKIASALQTNLIVRFGFMDQPTIDIKTSSYAHLTEKRVENEDPRAFRPSLAYVSINERTPKDSAPYIGGFYA